MARPLSNEKRLALLTAAIRTVADHGVAAPTAKIAQLAGVAEGTLFRYFPNKDALLNATYLLLKKELRAALLDDFPVDASVEARSRHVWLRYVAWGAAQPAHRRAMSQLAVSGVITDESKRLASEGFEAFRDLIVHWSGLCCGETACEASGAFASAILTAIADTTIDFIARDPAGSEAYAERGFKAFWRAAMNASA